MLDPLGIDYLTVIYNFAIAKAQVVISLLFGFDKTAPDLIRNLQLFWYQGKQHSIYIYINVKCYVDVLSAAYLQCWVVFLSHTEKIEQSDF